MDEQERTKEQEERVEEETSQPTSEETKESTSEPTLFSEEKVAELIKKAKAEIQSVKDAEQAALSRKHRAELRTLKTEQEKAQIEALEQAEKERFGDIDGDILKEVHELRRRMRLTASELSDTVAQGHAYQLSRKYGVDPEALLDCASKEEMEQKAITFKEEASRTELKRLQEELAIAKKAPTKIDSSIPSTAGVNWRDLTADEKIRRGTNK